MAPLRELRGALERIGDVTRTELTACGIQHVRDVVDGGAVRETVLGGVVLARVAVGGVGGGGLNIWGGRRM